MTTTAGTTHSGAWGACDDAAPAEEQTRRLRADAQRNLQLILAAARTVFARRGLDATLDDVAREAGLGVGTVYRRFRDKGELAEALFEESLAELVADADDALRCEDPWEGFVTFVGRFLERQACDCGLRDLLSSSAFGPERVEVLKERLQPVADHLVERAKAAGALRADFDSRDLPAITVMLGALADFSCGVRPQLWRRYLAMLLEGLRARPHEHEHEPIEASALEQPFSEEELDAAMGGWHPRHR